MLMMTTTMAMAMAVAMMAMAMVVVMMIMNKANFLERRFLKRPNHFHRRKTKLAGKIPSAGTKIKNGHSLKTKISTFIS